MTAIAKCKWRVAGDLTWGIYHVSTPIHSKAEDRTAGLELQTILRTHADLLAAAEAARLTLAELAQHPAFAGDAPEFNKGGIGYEAGQKLCSVIKAAKGGGRC